MFQVGDEVVYPPYGAGFVSAIEEKCIQGKQEKYYVINLILDDLSVSLPLHRLSHKNIRSVMNFKELSYVFSSLVPVHTDIKMYPLHQKQKFYEKILLEGDIQLIAKILQALVQKKRESGLNQSEREIYSKYFNMIVSEIMIIKKLILQDAENLLYELCENK
ncbi:hypothetical protein BTR23_19085 [Alkalihalophilus pseudofirmus]|nr:hypothetical protein BTR23_19085 [Alkalihalophilus pseudofirmus]